MMMITMMVVVVLQVTVSAPVTMASFPIPICTGPHPVPVCSSAHVPLCSAAQPTWAIPGACSMAMQLPGCAMQHFPMCTPLPVPHPHPHPMQSMLHPAPPHPHPAHPLSHNPHRPGGPVSHPLGQSTHQFHRLPTQVSRRLVIPGLFLGTLLTWVLMVLARLAQGHENVHAVFSWLRDMKMYMQCSRYSHSAAYTRAGMFSVHISVLWHYSAFFTL